MILFLIGLAFAVPVDRIAAIVNEEVITLFEIYETGVVFIEQNNQSDTTRRKAELQVLDSLVLRILITQELQRIGHDASDEEVGQAIENVAKSNDIDKALLRIEVEKSGMSWEQYRREMKDSIRQMKFNQTILQPRITVNEDALLDAYKRQIGNAPKQVDLGAIFLGNPAEEKISAVQKRISGGEDFSTVAKELDEGGFASQGGRMGTFSQGTLRPDLDKVAFEVEETTLSTPVCDQNGCFLLYVFSKTDTKPPSFESVRSQLLDAYYAERFEQEIKIWSDQAKKRAAIDIKLKTPE